jgi:diguanylate cyclase (GGDEF)-like protein
VLETSGKIILTSGDLTVDQSKARLQALGDLIGLISAARSYRELLTAIADESRSALGAATVSLSKFEPEYGRMRTLVNHGDLGPLEEPTPADEVYYLAEHPAARRTFDEGHAYVQVRGQMDPDDFTQQLLIREDKQSCLVLPVMFEGRIWGEFWATRTTAQFDFTEDDLEFGRLVVGQISGGVAQAEHFARIERYAFTDELTGIANRRMFEQKLDEAMDECVECGTPVGLIIADMNGLKRLNDDFGHDVGDNALREFGRFLAHTASTQPGTLAARLGGDEFALLTSGLDRDAVVSLATKLGELAQNGISDGAAIGVATSNDLQGPLLNRKHLMMAADAAQSRAKRGRSSIPVLARPTGEDVDPDELAAHETERRRHRGRIPHSPHALLEHLCSRLDGMPDASARERMTVVAEETSAVVNSANWWLSRVEAGSDVIVTTATGAARVPDDNLPDSYLLDDFPLSQQALGGAAFLIAADDLTSDPAETALMLAVGVTEMIMTGGSDRYGNRWLLEIPADSLTYPVGQFLTTVRCAVALALRH